MICFTDFWDVFWGISVSAQYMIHVSLSTPSDDFEYQPERPESSRSSSSSNSSYSDSSYSSGSSRSTVLSPNYSTMGRDKSSERRNSPKSSSRRTSRRKSAENISPRSKSPPSTSRRRRNRSAPDGSTKSPRRSSKSRDKSPFSRRVHVVPDTPPTGVRSRLRCAPSNRKRSCPPDVTYPPHKRFHANLTWKRDQPERKSSKPLAVSDATNRRANSSPPQSSRQSQQPSAVPIRLTPACDMITSKSGNQYPRPTSHWQPQIYTPSRNAIMLVFLGARGTTPWPTHGAVIIELGVYRNYAEVKARLADLSGVAAQRHFFLEWYTKNSCIGYRCMI